MIPKMIKVIAIVFALAVASVAILILGSIIGVVLAFLGPVIVLSFFLWIGWIIYKEYRDEQP